MADLRVPVLIAGGGPAGLAASICLSRLGVPSLLVEQHATTTDHPKATVVNLRTFELFRQWGVEDDVRAGGLAPERSRFIVWATSLTGFELGRLDLLARSGTDGADALRSAGAHSPSITGICPQDVYEPILRRAAEASPIATLRFDTRLVSFDVGPDGVEAVIRSLADERGDRVRARYLLACDGGASEVRERLGIAMIGPDNIGSILNVYFHADLGPYVEGREGPLYWIVNADRPGVFIALDNARRWLFNTPFRLAPGETVDRFTPDVCRAMVRRAAGDPALVVDVRSVDPWIMRSQVAERYRDGPVFLVGDAAHRFPPTGGFGMNTGVQDAHNLAWKIAGVLRGWASPAVLDTYESERRPVGQSNADQSYKNGRHMPAPGGGDGPSPLAVIEDDSPEGESMRQLVAAGIGRTREHFSAQGQAKGFVYESPIILLDGAACDERSTVERYVPSARPGSLAPHAWLRSDGRPRSLLDLFGAGFVLLAGPRGGPWRAAAADCGLRPLTVHVVGDDVSLDDPDPAAWGALYGVEEDGAVLVRPDGHVAWRAPALPARPDLALRTACDRAVGRG